MKKDPRVAEAQKGLDDLTPKVGLIGKAIHAIEDVQNAKPGLGSFDDGDTDDALYHLNTIRDRIMEEVMRQKAIMDPPIEDEEEDDE
jgi:hypothetical protein